MGAIGGVVLAWLLAPNREIELLIGQLGAESIEERTQAERDLRLRGLEAERPLERATRSPDPEVRSRARRLLTDIGAVSALIEDLKSDEVPGNAKRARVTLIRRYDSEVRRALLEAVRSDDVQQAVEAAFVLVERGDGAAALEASPKLVLRAAAAFARSETEGFDWVAANVLFRLSALQTAPEQEAAFRRALSGVPPHMLDERILCVRKISQELGVPFPRPFLRHYLLNLRNDNREGNAFDCERVVSAIGASAIPALRDLLNDPDSQARRIAANLLLEFDAKDIPASALVEVLGENGRAATRLAAIGEAVAPLLEQCRDGVDRLAAVRSARLLVRADPDRFREKAISVAVENLECDNFAENAREATILLVAIGQTSVPALRLALESDDEQAAVCAAIALKKLNALERVPERLTDQALRLVRRDWWIDETECVFELFAAAKSVGLAVLERLDKAGENGRKLANKIRVRLRKGEGCED